MSQEAKIKVELDTEPARAELRKLVKEGEAAAERIRDSLGGGGLGDAAIKGGVAGTAFGLAQKAASRIGGFIPDAISEGTVGVRSYFDSAFGGPEARAARGAREQTKDSFAEIVGRMKNPSITPEIRNYYNNVKDLREITERGGSAIDQALGGDYLKDAMETVLGAVSSGFDRIVEALPIGGK